MYFKYFLLPCACLLLLVGCNLEKSFKIELPPYQPKLVVECYLEHGKPYRLALTESVPYTSPAALPPLVNDALVVITHNGIRDTIRFGLSIDTLAGKVFNYTSPKIVDATTGGEYELEIIDRKKNRRVVGKANFLPKPTITKIETRQQIRSNGDTTYYVLTEFPDNDLTQPNYYRMLVNKDSLTSSPDPDISFEDRFADNGRIIIGSGFDFKRKDSLYVTIYHNTKPYYDFIESLEDAVRANGNPFAQPGGVKSTVQGGLGVFACLAYDRRFVRIN